MRTPVEGMVTCKNFVLKQKIKCGDQAKRFIFDDPGVMLENIMVNDIYDFEYVEELRQILTDEEYYSIGKEIYRKVFD